MAQPTDLTIELVESMRQRCVNDIRYKHFTGIQMINACVKVIQYYSIESKKQKLEEVLNSPPAFKTLPVKTVRLDNTKFNIFGIYHGTNPYEHILFNLSKPIIEQISSIIQAHHDPANNIEAYCEEGLSLISPIGGTQEIHDISHFAKMKGYRVLRSDVQPVPLTGRLRNLCKDLMAYAMIWKDKKKYTLRKIEEIGIRALSDMFYQQKYGEIYNMTSLGQPIDLELDYLLWLTSERKDDKDDKIVSSEERSLFTAKTLLELHNTRQLKQINYFGGLKHYAEIAYFLENPNYDFNKLKEYVRKKS